MKLSIVTINYNNAEGLRKTLASVASQTYADIEHVIVDGGSTDGSVEIIREYARANGAHAGSPTGQTGQTNNCHQIHWLSEPDKGIYHAMNKGIEVALGRRVVREDHTSTPIAHSQSPIAHSQSPIANTQSPITNSQSPIANSQSPISNNPSPISSTSYIQILNSGDMLFDANVTQRMIERLEQINAEKEENVGILYGNMIKVNATGKMVGKSGYTEYSLRQFYNSTLNHDCAYIRKDLFEKYGLYDENLKIVSDWKWYLQVIGLGQVKPNYVDIDVTIFDDGGISETNLVLRNTERRKVLEEILPPAVLWDSDTHAFEMEQMKRLRRWKLYWMVYFMERVLFKLEKWFKL